MLPGPNDVVHLGHQLVEPDLRPPGGCPEEGELAVIDRQSVLCIFTRAATAVPTSSVISASVIARCVPSEKTIRMLASGTPTAFSSSSRIGMKTSLRATRVGSLTMKATVCPGLHDLPQGRRADRVTDGLADGRGGVGELGKPLDGQARQSPAPDREKTSGGLSRTGTDTRSSRFAPSCIGIALRLAFLVPDAIPG